MCIVVLRVLLSFKAVNIFTKSERSAISFMKKLFALFMVVAMLTVASAAMAASTNLSASVENVIVTVGNSATFTLSATAGHGGTLPSEAGRDISAQAEAREGQDGVGLHVYHHLPVVDIGSRLHDVHGAADVLQGGVQNAGSMLHGLALDIVGRPDEQDTYRQGENRQGHQQDAEAQLQRKRLADMSDQVAHFSINWFNNAVTLSPRSWMSPTNRSMSSSSNSLQWSLMVMALLAMPSAGAIIWSDML